LVSFGLTQNGFHDLNALVYILISSIFLSWVFWSKARLTDLTNEIQPAESIQWSWRQALKGGFVVWVLFFLLGAITWMTNPTSLGNIFSGPLGLALLCMSVSLVSLLFIVPITLMSGLKVKKVEAKTYPNQGIWLSLKNTLIITAGFGALTLLAELLFHSLSPSYKPDLLFIVLFFALWEGGLAVIQHYTLRLVFWRKKNIPWNYARFLDYATERIFLRKVGGGYIFIHRLLMEHFAELGKPEEKI
jgi:hypothetical protein